MNVNIVLKVNPTEQTKKEIITTFPVQLQSSKQIQVIQRVCQETITKTIQK